MTFQYSFVKISKQIHVFRAICKRDLVTDSHPIQGKKEWFPVQLWGNLVAHEHACLHLFLTNWPINRQKNVNIISLVNITLDFFLKGPIEKKANSRLSAVRVGFPFLVDLNKTVKFIIHPVILTHTPLMYMHAQ